ncbi:type II secretion system F family protein [Halomicrobium urmianum]|uniref:type II secretion system F family protein n=1 Tax=Halomicrobium urmianum TaxID=1586233 RepID=UPI001CD941FC|nr:type II secretion system F family protein [Halomicrobium urmianum]
MSIEAKGSEQLSAGGALGDTFYPAFQYLFDEEGEFVSNVEDKLAEARMADNVEMFLSRALAVGAISGVSLWIVGTFIGYFLVTLFFGGGGESLVFIGVPLPTWAEPVVRAIKLPAVIGVTGVVFGAIGFGIGFGSLISIPYFRSSAREREINVLLSDAISFMYALSVGGLNQLEILQAMAKADDTYGECAKEFQSIVLETEYFDTDYRTAIRNQAMETPSDELSQFLTDMLSIINSGGDMTTFLEDQKDKHMRTAKQEQQKMLDTLELFGEMYMTLSLFPLLLIIILVIMSMMGNSQEMLLYGTVYGLIPLTGLGFLVLVSTVTQDTIGDGYLRPDGSEDELVVDDGLGILDLGRIENYTGGYAVFDRIKSREGTYELMQIVRKPHLFFRDHPLMVLGLTIPLTVVAVTMTIAFDWAPLSIEGMTSNPVRGTFFWVYVPLYINLIPLAVFYEWNVRSRKAIIGNLSENLRKLASANDTGMTLLESIKVVSETSAGKLADEFEVMHSKVNYGTNLKNALREFNNSYHVPRLARTVKLISEAQEASSQIQDVLSTAAQASENQDDIDRERISRTRMQVVIILMTYLTLLGVMALLKAQFLSEMAALASQGASSGGGAGPAGGFGQSLDTDLLSMLFFHAVVIQAILSSFIAGYIRTVKILAGVKFAVLLSTVALVVWMAI